MWTNNNTINIIWYETSSITTKFSLKCILQYPCMMNLNSSAIFWLHGVSHITNQILSNSVEKIRGYEDWIIKHAQRWILPFFYRHSGRSSHHCSIIQFRRITFTLVLRWHLGITHFALSFCSFALTRIMKTSSPSLVLMSRIYLVIRKS